MGKGAGKIFDWKINIYAGSILFEFSTKLNEKSLQNIFKNIRYRLGVPIKLVKNQNLKL
jgi:ribosomal protein L16/L10AE